MAKILKTKITFTEEVLGSSPNNEEIMADFIASKAPDAKKRAEEIESVGVEGILERGMTVFPRDKHDNPFVYDYMIKGMLKDSIGFLRKITGTKSSKIKAYKKAVDGLIFVKERRIPFKSRTGRITIGDCQRPLRASTAQGERVALAMSETVPAGSYICPTFQILDDSLLPVVKECLDYGKLHGFGQWRNSGKGKFTWEEISCEDADITDLI